MTFQIASSQPRNYLVLTAALVTCLILLINTSFKLFAVQGMYFTASSVLCSFAACLYLLVLKECNLGQQRHVLNQCLLALYLFSIGIYLLINLPSANFVRDNMAYQIVFEDIPKKFFAATLAFGLSFYLPHLLFCTRQTDLFTSPRKRLLLALFGGFSFFTIDFLLLFSDPRVQNFEQIYIDSLMIAAGIMLSYGVAYLACHLFGMRVNFTKDSVIPNYLTVSSYYYLVGFAVIVMLICLACEYKLISLGSGWIIPASAILSPLVLITSNITGEVYGYKANLRLMLALILCELFFEGVMMLSIMIPSPDFFDLNPFFHFIMPRRIPATTLALLVTYSCNALMLRNLKLSNYGGGHQGLRIFIANCIAISLLCFVNYSLLFAGIYPYEQIFSLAISSWFYKLIFIIISLPVALRLCRILSGAQESINPNNPVNASRHNQQ